MADENQHDPPWGRPLRPSELEGEAPPEEQAADEGPAPAEEPATREQPPAGDGYEDQEPPEPEEAYHDEPEGAGSPGATAGDVLVFGDSVPNMADDDLFEMRKRFGVLFQDGALFGSMNLFDNVAFPLRQHTDKGEDEIGEIVNRRLREVGLANSGDKMPNELSGGMRKRAGFARALVLDPDIVLFDEPDSGLDPVRTALLCELIQEIHEENGGAYVVITHDIMSARRVADYIAILWKGRSVEAGPASELFNSDNQFVRQFLSGESQGPMGME